MTTTSTQANGPAPAAAPKVKLTQPEADALASVPPLHRWAVSIDAVLAKLGPSSKRTADNVRRVLDNDAARVLFATSAPMAGKTTWACALLIERARKSGIAGGFYDVHQLAADPAFVASAIGCPGTIVLDGLGEEADPKRSPVGRIIAARHAAMLPTIATSPLTASRAEELLGIGVVRRLFEPRSGAEIIDVQLRA